MRLLCVRHSTMHLTLAIVWIILLVPTVTVWRTSILWVALMTGYNIVNSHWSAWLAAKAKERAEASNSSGD